MARLGAGWSAAPGGDAGVRKEAPERRREAEGPGPAAEGLQHHHQQRTKSAADLQQHGEIIIYRLSFIWITTGSRLDLGQDKNWIRIRMGSGSRKLHLI